MIIKYFEKCGEVFGFDDGAEVDAVGNRISVFGAVINQNVFRNAADDQFANEIVVI